MSKIKDLVGHKYGNLLVIEFASLNNRKNALWMCKCDCGNNCIAIGSDLRRGRTQSCGCLLVWNTTHGMTDRSEYHIWCNIKARCFNKNHKSYNRYGGRGIAICDEWKDSFEAFFRDMGNRPSIDHSIDRINPNGNYEPSNCRWATQIEQQRNRGNNKILNIYGEDKCQSEWCELYGIGQSTFLRRINYGWSAKEALEMPVRPLKKSEPK